MKVFRALLAGITGAAAMSGTMYLLRQAGINVSLEALLGSMFEAPSNLSPWMIGFIAHLVIGAVMALIYAAAFELVQLSGLLMGGGLGLAHGLMAGLFMSGISAMNPFVPNPNAPGPFLSHLQFGPAIFLLLHFIYGAVVALAYGPPLHRPQFTPKHVA